MLRKLISIHAIQRELDKANSVEMIGFASWAISVLNNAELSITEAENSSLIHMDADQSFLPVPSPVTAAIFESFARQNLAESEIDVNPSIKQFLKSNYGFPVDNSTELIYADSTLALFNKLVLCCIQEGGTLCFPAGSNGNYVSAAKFLKANIVTIPTNSEQGYKLTEKTLSGIIDTVHKPWIYISGPTVNPTGLLYTNKEIENLLTLCAKTGAKVIIDTSFSGLEFDFEGWGGWNLAESLSKLNSFNPSFCVSLLGGLSLKMLTGALKFGFLVLDQPLLVDAFHSFPGLSKPHSTVRYAVKKLLSLREQKSGVLWDSIAKQIRNLENRSKRLKEVNISSLPFLLLFVLSFELLLHSSDLIVLFLTLVVWSILPRKEILLLIKVRSNERNHQSDCIPKIEKVAFTWIFWKIKFIVQLNTALSC